MASLVSGTHGESINKTFSHLKEKMADLTREIRKTDERTKGITSDNKEINVNTWSPCKLMITDRQTDRQIDFLFGIVYY